MNELHLFAGAGGGILGGILLGHRCMCAVEIEPYCRKVLFNRQQDGILPRFPIWDDVRTFDGRPWRGKVDIVCGGFPCQDISTAGRGAGITGARSGLWKDMFRVVCEIRPRFVFVENSPALLVRGMGTVLGDLASIGFNAEWDVFSAAEVGAAHLRQRLFILANTKSNQVFQLPKASMASHPIKIRQPRPGKFESRKQQAESPFREASGIVNAVREGSLPYVCRRHDGVAHGVERCSAIGNGQVPAVVRLAWETLAGAGSSQKDSR